MSELTFLGQQVTILEVVAMLTGIAGVYLTIRQSVWCFPVGIVNVALYAIWFFSPGMQLYADALLQCIYILLLAFGWYKWTTKQVQKTTFPVRLNSTVGLKLFVITTISTFVLGFFLKKYTNASLPWIDSALTCASLAAQWMIAKKIIDNWIVWIIVDVVYIPVYIYKHSQLTAVLYFIFLIMAFRGYREWKVSLRHD